MKPRWKRTHSAGRLLLLGLILFMLLRWFEHNQVYHPGRVLAATPAGLRRPAEDVWFQASDGVRLNGWFIPARENSPRRRKALLFCHGNGGNIGDRLDMCTALLATGANVFIFDYRGYGRSTGRPGEAGTYLDVQAAYEWLQQRGFPGTNIIAMGESLGGGIASELAVRERLAGLILQSTFTSIPDIGAELFPWLPVRRLSTIKYDTYSRLPRIRIPVLVMHSRTDELAAFRHAERNFAAANEPKLLWELEGGHNEALADPDHFIGGLEKFLQLLEVKQDRLPSPALEN